MFIVFVYNGFPTNLEAYFQVPMWLLFQKFAFLTYGLPADWCCLQWHNVHTKFYQIGPVTHENEALMHVWTI